LCQFWT